MSGYDPEAEIARHLNRIQALELQLAQLYDCLEESEAELEESRAELEKSKILLGNAQDLANFAFESMKEGANFLYRRAVNLVN